MDLGTIKSNLENNHYTNSRLWARDVNLVWDNAKQYNLRKTIVYESAEVLHTKCKKAFASIPKTEPELWALKLAKINQRLKSFLRDNPVPESSTFPRRPDLILRPDGRAGDS
jgi:hypothetical protein